MLCELVNLSIPMKFLPKIKQVADARATNVKATWSSSWSGPMDQARFARPQQIRRRSSSENLWTSATSFCNETIILKQEQPLFKA